MTVLTAWACMMLASCYQEPLSLTDPSEPGVPCIFNLSSKYLIELPCSAMVKEWGTDGDPGVGILNFNGHEVYFKYGSDLFESLSSIECKDELMTDYYTTWLFGEVRVLVDERYDIPMLFIHFIDRTSGDQMQFWTESWKDEERIMRRLLSIRR